MQFGNRAVRAFLSEGHTVIPINPHESEIEGLKSYASVLEVPGRIDMASLYVPPEIGDVRSRSRPAPSDGVSAEPGAPSAPLDARADAPA